MTIDQAALVAELVGRTRKADGSTDLDTALRAVTSAVVDLGVADWAGITERVGKNRFESLGVTDPRIQSVDDLQYELDEGPCVQAVYEQGLLVSGRVALDDRWPRWGPAAQRHGIGAVVGVHLYTTGAAMGALNLYSADTREYTDDDLEVALLIGGHASIVLAHYRTDRNLWKAIEARHRIGQAQGILMERFQIGAEQAFAVLRRLSQQHNVRLHLIADQIVTTRQLPTETPDAPGPDAAGAPAP